MHMFMLNKANRLLSLALISSHRQLLQRSEPLPSWQGLVIHVVSGRQVRREGTSTVIAVELTTSAASHHHAAVASSHHAAEAAHHAAVAGTERILALLVRFLELEGIVSLDVLPNLVGDIIDLGAGQDGTVGPKQ